jgi:hypothetical protein
VAEPLAAANPGPAAPPAGAKPTAKPTGKASGSGAKGAAKPVAPPAPSGPAKASCTGIEGQVVLLPAEADVRCNAEFEQCEGKLELTATNCTGEFQSFYKVEIFEGGRRQQVVEFDPAGIGSPNGGQWKDSVVWTTPGELEAVVYYHPPGQSGDLSARAKIVAINRALAAAKEACVKCEGTWGRYGVNKFEGCNCKMPDAGKTCYDGDECGGYCLFRRYDSEAREEGECSETQRVTGCVGIIYKGASKVPPRKPPPRKQPTCMD